MSGLESRFSSAAVLVDQFNAALPADSKSKLDWPALKDALIVQGAVSEEALQFVTWEDLQSLGIPKVLARQMSNVFREKKIEPPAVGLTPSSSKFISEMRASAMSFEDLLSNYDPKGERNPSVTKRLKELVGDVPCIVFESEVEERVDITKSVLLMREVRNHESPRKFYSEGSNVFKVYPVGQVPSPVGDENPLRPGALLRSDETDPETGRSWAGVSLAVRQLVYLARTETDEISAPTDQQYHEWVDLLVGVNFIQIQNRFPKAAIKMGEKRTTGELPTLKKIRGTISKPPNDPFYAGKHVRT